MFKVKRPFGTFSIFRFSTTLYCSPSILQPFALRLPLIIKTTQFGPKVPLCVLNDLYFNTNCSIRPHFLGPMGGLKIEGLLYLKKQLLIEQNGHKFGPPGTLYQYLVYTWYFCLSSVQGQSGVIRYISDMSDFCQLCILKTAGHRVKRTKLGLRGYGSSVYLVLLTL